MYSAKPVGAEGPPDRVQRTSMRERIGSSLRAALVAGDMVPGETYSAPALAELFGVSPTPVREAMLDLINERMIAVVPNKGFRVVEVSENDLDEITELRRLIEIPTIGRVATLITPDQIADAESDLATMSAAVVAGDMVSFIEADRTFHLHLIAIAGNVRLTELVDRLRTSTRLFGLQELAARGDLARWNDEHGELLDALSDGDRRRAEEIMSRHLGHIRGQWPSSDGAEADA